MMTTCVLLCLAAGSHMTPQLMTAFPPSETPSAYSWALASLRGPSGNVLHPLKKLHICGGDPYFLWALCNACIPKNTKCQGSVWIFDRCALEHACIYAARVISPPTFALCASTKIPTLTHVVGLSRTATTSFVPTHSSVWSEQETMSSIRIGQFHPRHSSIHITRWMNLRDIWSKNI